MCLLIVHAVICDLHGLLLVTGTGLDVGPAWQWAVVLYPAWVLPEWHLPSHSAQPGSCQDSPGSFNIGVDAKGRSCTRQRRGHPCQLDGMVGTHASTMVHYRCAVLSFPSTNEPVCVQGVPQAMGDGELPYLPGASNMIVGPTTCVVISTYARNEP